MAHAVGSRNEQGRAQKQKQKQAQARAAVRRRWWSGWPHWAGYAAAVWSLGYGLAGLYWALGGAGYPFAKAAVERSSGSVLDPSPVAVVAPVIAVVGLVGAVCGVLMARRRCTAGAGRRALLVVGWTLAATLTVAVQDYTLIAVLAFAPLLVVFAFTGVPGPQDGVGDILFWHRDNLLILFVGGVLWTLATLAHQRRAGGLCAHCGRGGRAASWTTPESAARWGRRAVLVAVLSTVPYEVTRVAWFFGYPLGITDAFLKDMQDTPGLLGIGLGLGLASVVGGVLTHGLIARWGEVWPRWVPFKAGRPVAPATAIVPALLVSVVAVPGGLMMIRAGNQPFGWGTNYPAMLWVVWGAALGAATLAYYLRRRGTCGYCAQG
ncbi:NYN domain-containing protein [Streptomyces erythrochromogenes]|uniref:NYN domain-containing protein n=1 Tax=Streptomyces erythrochromogenes TaxID=285574 RepID=UPI00225AB498|nr:NYN domain-containing protein [Streptomyces erythrochromogenes]MCX5584966.1 NYN domain-containing protein [Streptomyces erythrochromogenes]